MKKIFIFIINVVLIFLFGSCSEQQSVHSDGILRTKCLTGSNSKCASSESSQEEEIKDNNKKDKEEKKEKKKKKEKSYSSNFNSNLDDQLQCNTSGKFFDYDSNTCTSYKIMACTDKAINNFFEGVWQNVGNSSEWNWSDEFCTELSSVKDLSEYRQCYFDKSVGTLRISRLYNENNKLKIHTCIIEDLELIDGDDDYDDGEEDNNND